MINDMLQLELDKSKKTKSTLEEIEIMIALYKEDLDKDIVSLETLLKVRSDDSKFKQIESALDFVMKDLMNYAEKKVPKKEEIVVKVDKVVKDKPLTGKAEKVEEKTKRPRSKRIDIIFLRDEIHKLFEANPDMIYTTKQIWDWVLTRNPSVRDAWKRSANILNYMFNKTDHKLKRVGKGEYCLK